MKQHPRSAIAPLVLEGEVFGRLQRFTTLPTNLQEDAKQFQAYVEQDQSRLFQNHRHALVKNVYGVKGHELVAAIIHWLQTWHTLVQEAPTAGDSALKTLVYHAQVQKTSSLAFAAANAGETWEAPSEDDPTEASRSLRPPCVAMARLEHARQVAEALVLVGFLTPYKEDHTHLSSSTPDHYVHGRALLVPVASSTTKFMATSIWSAVDGAVYARSLKRKAGLLGHGKGVYVVVNEKTRKLYLFSSDLAREPIAKVSASTVRVQIDRSCYEFGVLVLSQSPRLDVSELINTETKALRDEFVNACVSIGAQFEESGADKLIKAGLDKIIGRDAVREVENTRVNQTTEQYKVALVSAAAETISQQGQENHHQEESLTDASTPTKPSVDDLPSLMVLSDAVIDKQPAFEQHCIDMDHQNQPDGACLQTGLSVEDIPTMTKHIENGVVVYSAP